MQVYVNLPYLPPPKKKKFKLAWLTIINIS